MLQFDSSRPFGNSVNQDFDLRARALIALLTASFSPTITCSGFSAANIAVPATITFEPTTQAFISIAMEFQREAAVHTSVGANVNGSRSDSTVNFNVLVRESLAELGNLWYAALDEFLTTSSYQ